jgi:hypothetical protein
MAAEDITSANYPSNDNTASFDFVIPLSPFERILLQGIETAYSPVLAAATYPLRASLKILKEAGNESGGHATSQELSIESNFHTLASSQLRISAEEAGLSKAPDSLEDNDVLKAINSMGLFQGWAWAAKVKRSVSNSQEEDSLKDYEGDRIQSFLDAIHFLKWPYDANAFRTNMLLDHNSHVYDNLACREFHFVPLATDIPHWSTLVGMGMVGCWTQLMRIGSETEDSAYEIWKVVQQFSLRRRHPNNATLVADLLFRSIPFRRKFVIKKALTEAQMSGDSRSAGSASRGTKVEIFDRQALSSMETAAPDLSKQIAEEITDDLIVKLLKIFATPPLEDPRSYVEIIPWEKLTPASSTELKEARIPIYLPHEADTNRADQRWMLWDIPSCNFFDFHHLYTEAEVYQYCVVNSWWFPGHSYRGAVIFALSPLNDTEFVEDLKNFWECWVRPNIHSRYPPNGEVSPFQNDCALTVDSDGQLYLLETIPGRQYRAKQKRQGHIAALLYFRNILEDYAQQRDSDEIKAILDADYSPQYQSMLRYIKPEQLVQVDPKPFARGANGAVYNAFWRQPMASLRSIQPREPEIAVVLKQIRSEFMGPESLKKIIHEVQSLKPHSFLA